MKKLLILCLLAAAALPLSAKESTAWTTDYQAALAQAKAQQCRVFLFFTGSDWCIWCKRLNAEILSKPEFAHYAADKLVLVEVDFPQTKKLPSALKAQNDRLAEKYRIEGYPTVIVLDSNGAPVGQLGYQEGGPGPFLAKLGKM